MSIASPELCAFVRKQAPAHYPTSDAPSTWAELQAWNRCWGHGFACGVVSLPVHDGGCEQTIYPDAQTNYAFRAWHDSLHIANDLSFSRGDEIRVGLIHMQQARAAGLSKRDQDVLIADTIGQIEYYYKRGRYVKNQARFVTDVLARGLAAVLNSNEEY